jgi:hypothetical protein
MPFVGLVNLSIRQVIVFINFSILHLYRKYKLTRKTAMTVFPKGVAACGKLTSVGTCQKGTHPKNSCQFVNLLKNQGLTNFWLVNLPHLFVSFDHFVRTISPKPFIW